MKKVIATFLLQISTALILCFFLGAGPSRAQTLPDGLIGLSSTASAVLYSIDPSSGAATPILTLDSGASLTGLSFLGGILYGVDLTFGDGVFFFGSISRHGVVKELSSQNGSSNWWGLASDEVNGVLYSIDTEKNNVLTAQYPDGTFATIGSGTGTDGAGMAYDNTHGILYALGSNGSLYTISTTTGSSSLIGPTGITDDSLYLGLAYDECAQALYANDGANEELYIIDVTSGQATLIGPNGAGVRIDGLAWKGPCGPRPHPIINPIPTLSEWGMISAAAALGLIGLFFALKRKRAGVQA